MYRFNYKLNGYKHTQGFSLVELMVVMAIMAILMSLSGGLMQKSINQQAKQVELEQVKQLFKRLSYQAYYGGHEVSIRLQNKQMYIVYNDNTLAAQDKLTNKSDIDSLSSNDYLPNKIEFEQLTFIAQDYTISTKGVITPSVYGILELNGSKQFPLKSLFSHVTL